MPDRLAKRQLSPFAHAKLPHIVAGCVLVLGAVVLLGWHWNNEHFFRGMHGLPAMPPNTALGFIFAGSALWLLAGEELKSFRILAGQALALSAFLIGLLTSLEYLELAPMLSIDRALVPLFSHTPFVLRPSPQTAIAFALAGSAIFLLGSKKTRAVALTQWLSLSVLLIASVVFFKYVYGESPLRADVAEVGMALHSAVGFILLALGVLLAKPNSGLMRAIIERTGGALVIRRLLPVIVLVPLLLGWLVMLGLHLGVLTEQFGIAMLQGLSIAALALLIAYVTRIVNREEKLKLCAEERARQYEAQLTHINRLQSMGEMVSGIVHEVNQPLTAIAVYAVTIKRMLSEMENIPPDVLRSLERIGSHAGLATEIVQRMREFARRQCPPRSTVLLQDLIGEVVKFVSDAAQEHAVQLEVALDDNLPPVELDSVQIEQVLLNIVRNAIEAMQAAQAEPRVVMIHAYVNATHELQVDIQDTGPGMDAETLSHVFDAFFSTKGAEGMGMGLAISRSIIKDHRGRIWAESAPGQGACFSFTLPL